ncbi:unnamed protein product [Trichobilharzia regenti]|nr:unnamed protein product [Trichobilharzia regenti]
MFMSSFAGGDKDVHYQAVSNCQKHVGILSGYRKPSASFTSGVLSIFQLHNETMNIWTQIIPTVYFIIELILNFFHVGERFLLIYLVTAVVFLFTSSCAHTFSCLSPRARHVCFFCDYIGITLYSFGFGLNLCDLFLFTSVLFCICGTHLSCQTRFWKPSFMRNIVRMGAFSINVIYLALPIIWRSFSCRYLTNGKFDIFGHSHQIFHVLIAFASVTQYYALRTDLQERNVKLKLMSHAPSIPLSLFCLALVVLCNIIIFLKFYKRLCRTIKSKTL